MLQTTNQYDMFKNSESIMANPRYARKYTQQHLGGKNDSKVCPVMSLNMICTD